jgi:hypothetical protein
MPSTRELTPTATRWQHKRTRSVTQKHERSSTNPRMQCCTVAHQRQRHHNRNAAAWCPSHCGMQHLVCMLKRHIEPRQHAYSARTTQQPRHSDARSPHAVTRTLSTHHLVIVPLPTTMSARTHSTRQATPGIATCQQHTNTTDVAYSNVARNTQVMRFRTTLRTAATTAHCNNITAHSRHTHTTYHTP